MWSAGIPSAEEPSWSEEEAESPQLSELPFVPLSAGTSAKQKGKLSTTSLAPLIPQTHRQYVFVTICIGHMMEEMIYLLLCVKDLSLLVLGSPQLLLLEVSISQRLWDFQPRDVYFGSGGNAKLLVSSAQGNPVESQRTCERSAMIHSNISSKH